MDIQADLAKRAALLSKAEHDPKLQQLLLETCKRDIVYWFNNFCWTYNPRAEVTTMPFNLYPFQEWCVHEWLGCISNQEDFGIEKSRDMGVSWLIMLIFQYCWLFKDGWNFHCGSRKEDLVDVEGDVSTLFGKFCFNLDHLPKWMKPKSIYRKSLFVRNEDNGNLLTGEATNPSFARGGRYRAILYDELAFWETADASVASGSASTNCRIFLSTPCGENNKYAQLMNDPRNELKLPPGPARFPLAERYVS